MPADPTHPEESSTSADSSQLILIRVLHLGLFPQDGIGDLREDVPLETVANRSLPMACGPDVHQAARGGRSCGLRRGLEG
jgi:hypothetical protein